MARSPIDLPRMQNQARPRVAVAHGPTLVPLDAERGAEAAQAADDAAIRACRPGPALQSRRQRGPAQPRLCLCHAGAWRADARLGRSLFLASARGRRDPHRAQARRRDDRGGAAARHDRGHRRDPRRDRPAVRPRHRRAGRGPDQAEEARPRLQGGRSRPRTCASSCSPSPTTCACCWSSSPTACTTCARSRIMPPEARRRIAEETLDIYAPLAGRMGMQDMREELEDLSFRELNPDAYSVISERLEALAARNERLDRGDRAAADQEARRQRHRGRGQRPAQARLFDLAQDGAQGGRLRAALRHLRLPRRRRRRRRMLPGARHRPHDLAGRARPLQGLHLDAQAERLPLDPHHRDRPGQAARRAADPHPRDAPDRRIRHRRACALQGRSSARRPRCCRARVERLCLAAPHHRAARRRLQSRGVPRAHQARAVPGSGVLLHAEGQADRAAARGDADRFRLCGAHRRRQHARSAPRSTARSRRSCSALQNGDEVEIITSKAQTAPPAAWESIVVTGKARAAIRRATRAAVRNAIFRPRPAHVERLCQRAKIAYSDEKLQGALPRLARASIDDVMSAVGRGEMKASDVVRAMYPDYKDERVDARAAPKPESGWFGLKRAKAVKFKRAGERRERRRDPDPRHQQRPAGALRAEGGAVPGDRIVGIMTPGEASPSIRSSRRR